MLAHRLRVSQILCRPGCVSGLATCDGGEMCSAEDLDQTADLSLRSSDRTTQLQNDCRRIKRLCQRDPTMHVPPSGRAHDHTCGTTCNSNSSRCKDAQDVLTCNVCVCHAASDSRPAAVTARNRTAPSDSGRLSRAALMSGPASARIQTPVRKDLHDSFCLSHLHCLLKLPGVRRAMNLHLADSIVVCAVGTDTASISMHVFTVN